MLKISPAQMAAFAEAELAHFETEMVAHTRPLLPLVSASLSDAQLLLVVRGAIERAGRRELSTIGALRLFIELSILFGSQFDADVQHSWAGEYLGSNDAATQYHRAEELFAASGTVIDQLCGDGDEHLIAAYQRLAAFATHPPAVDRAGFTEQAMAQMERVYPQKYAFVSERALRSLIAVGRSSSKSRGLKAQEDRLLMILMMFLFGQGCATDPLYPQIGAALSLRPVRGERTFAAAIARWLDEALAGEERQSA